MHLQTNARLHRHRRASTHTHAHSQRAAMQAVETKSHFYMNKKTDSFFLFLEMYIKIDTFNKIEKCDQSAGAKCDPHICIQMQFSFWLSAIYHMSFYCCCCCTQTKLNLKTKNKKCKFCRWLVKCRNWRWRITVKQSPSRTAGHTLMHSGLCVYVCECVCVCFVTAVENLVACFSAHITELCAALVHVHGHTHIHTHQAWHVYIAHAPPNNKNNNDNMRAALTVLARKCDGARCTFLIEFSALFHKNNLEN